MSMPEMVYDQPKGCIQGEARRFAEQARVRSSSNQLKIQARELKRAKVSLAYTLL